MVLEGLARKNTTFFYELSHTSINYLIRRSLTLFPVRLSSLSKLSNPVVVASLNLLSTLSTSPFLLLFPIVFTIILIHR